MQNLDDLPDVPCEVRIQALFRYNKDGQCWTHFSLSNRLEEDIGVEFFLALNETTDQLIAEGKTFGTRLFCAIGVANFSADTFIFPGSKAEKLTGGVISNRAVIDYVNHPKSSLQIEHVASTEKFMIMKDGEQKCEIEFRENLISILVKGLGSDLTKVQIATLLVFGVKAAFTAYQLTLYPMPLGHPSMENRFGIVSSGMSENELHATLCSMTHARLKLWSFMDFSTIIVNCMSYTGKIIFIFELVSQIEGSDDCYNLNVRDNAGNLLFTATGMAMDECLRVFSVDGQSEEEKALIGYVNAELKNCDKAFISNPYRAVTQFYDASDKKPVMFAHYQTNMEQETVKKIANASNCFIVNRMGDRVATVTCKWGTLQFEFEEEIDFVAKFKIVLLAYGMKTFLTYLMKVCKVEVSTPKPQYIKEE